MFYKKLGQVVGRLVIRLVEKDADSGVQNVSGLPPDVRSGNPFVICLTVRLNSNQGKKLISVLSVYLLQFICFVLLIFKLKSKAEKSSFGYSKKLLQWDLITSFWSLQMRFIIVTIFRDNSCFPIHVWDQNLSCIFYNSWHLVTFCDIMCHFVTLCVILCHFVTFCDILWHFFVGLVILRFISPP